MVLLEPKMIIYFVRHIWNFVDHDIFVSLSKMAVFGYVVLWVGSHCVSAFPFRCLTGGRSFGCPTNAGAAGTFYDAVPRRLIVSNHNLSTDTDTLLFEFPNHPLWTNIYIQDHARATVPLLWSRLQVIHIFCSCE